MNENFATEEKLYRAVYPSRMYWKENGQLSSAAFLSKSAGCSMERGDMREDVEVISHMRELNFRGHIVSVQVKNCLDADAVVEYSPSKANEYHSEIYGNEEHRHLSPRQRRHLAETAIIVD